MQRLKRFWNHEGGMTAIEYGLIVGLIAMAVLASMSQVFGKVMANLLLAVS